MSLEKNTKEESWNQAMADAGILSAIYFYRPIDFDTSSKVCQERPMLNERNWNELTAAELNEVVTPAELERLAILSEECGEVQQAIGKIIRHGYKDKHLVPNKRTGTILNNRSTLELEIGDMLVAVDRVIDNDLHRGEVTKYYDEKKAMNQFLHHNHGAYEYSEQEVKAVLNEMHSKNDPVLKRYAIMLQQKLFGRVA